MYFVNFISSISFQNIGNYFPEYAISLIDRAKTVLVQSTWHSLAELILSVFYFFKLQIDQEAFSIKKTSFKLWFKNKKEKLEG